MRKITLFLISLFLTVGAMAQIEIGTEYRIKEKSTGLYLNVGGASANNYGEVYGSVKKDGDAANVQIFTFVDAGNGQYYVKSNSGEYITYTGSGAGWNVNADSDLANAHALTFEEVGINEFKIKCYNQSKSANKYFKWEYVGDSRKYHPFNDADAGAIFVVEQEHLPVYTVTYNYFYNGNVVKTVTNEVLQGNSYPAHDLNLYGASYENIPTGTVTEDTEVTINVTFNLPFEFAATYDAIGDNWYYLSIGQEAHLLYHVDGADHIALNKTEVEKGKENAYLWAFVGNPFDGYKLVNRAKGDGWVLSSSTNTFDGSTGAKTHPIMTAEPVGEGKNTYWIPTASSDLGEGGFYLGQKDANEGKNKMNNRDNKLAYWNTGADHGSTFTVVKRPIEIEITYNFTYNGQVLEGYTQTKTVLVGQEYPNIEIEFPFGITAAKPVGNVAADAATTVIIPVEENLPFEYYDSYAAVEAANGWYNLIMHSNWNTGDGAKRYRTYLSHVENGSTLAWGTERSLTNPSDAHYWAFVGNPITGFSVVNKAKGDGYVLSSNGSANPLMLNKDLSEGYNTTWQIAGRKYDVSREGDYILEGAWFCLKHTNGQYMNANAGNGNVNFWTDNDNGSGILAVKPLTIKASAGYATYYSDNYITMPSTMGAEVYYVNNVQDGYAKFEQIKTEVIPAETGIVVKYDNDVVYAPEITSKGTSTAITGNLLKGTTKRTLITKEENKAYYALGLTEGVGFYNAVNGDNENEFYNNAFKAYLEIGNTSGGQTSSASLRFDFDGITTAIEEVETEAAETVIYDLTGRRVNEITKAGVYIVNGKKILVK